MHAGRGRTGPQNFEVEKKPLGAEAAMTISTAKVADPSLSEVRANGDQIED